MSKLSNKDARQIVLGALTLFHKRSFLDEAEWTLTLDHVGLSSKSDLALFSRALASELNSSHGAYLSSRVDDRLFVQNLNPSHTLSDVVGHVQTVYNFGLKGTVIPPDE